MHKPQVMLDSGAYTAFRLGRKIDINKYAEFVIEHGKEFAGCFNLDEINNTKKSYENWQYLKSLGAETIPVYHMVTGEDDYLKKYLKQTDFIALGAIANLDQNKRRQGLDRIWKDYLTDKKGKAICKVHGLGLTVIDQMTRYPWYSVDSFTPVISAVWGGILLPKVKDDEFNYLGMEMCHISDQGKPSPGNTSNWINYPRRLQMKYQELFEEKGFTLGDVFHKERRPTRKDKRLKREDPMSPLWNLRTPSDTEKHTIVNHWEERMRWNLTYWVELQRLIPQVKMCMGVSTTTHLSIFELVKPKLDILISYAYMSDDIYKAIRRYIR